MTTENSFQDVTSGIMELFLFEEEITREQYKNSFIVSLPAKKEPEIIPTDAEVLNSINDLEQWVYNNTKRLKSRLTLEDFYVSCDSN